MKNLMSFLALGFLGFSLAFPQDKISKEFVIDLNNDGHPEKSCVYNVSGRPELRIIDGKDSLNVRKFPGFSKFIELSKMSTKNKNSLIYLVERNGNNAKGFEIFYSEKDKMYLLEYKDFDKTTHPEFF